MKQFHYVTSTDHWRQHGQSRLGVRWYESIALGIWCIAPTLSHPAPEGS